MCSIEEAETLSTLHLGFKGALPPATSSRRLELVRVVRTILSSVFRVAVGVDIDHRRELFKCLLESAWGRFMGAQEPTTSFDERAGQALVQLQMSYKVCAGPPYTTTTDRLCTRQLVVVQVMTCTVLVCKLRWCSMQSEQCLELTARCCVPQAVQGNTAADKLHKRTLLSIVANHGTITEVATFFGETEYMVKEARTHAAVHGPGQATSVRTFTRPGRSINAGKEDVINFISLPENLHRLPSSQGKGYAAGHVLMKRTEKMAALYRKYCVHCREHLNKKPCSESFFRKAYKTIPGVVFSDRAAMECGCVICISMIIAGWRELGDITKALCTTIKVEYRADPTVYEEVEQKLLRQLEDARRFWHAEYKIHFNNGVNHPAHCPQYALCTPEDQMSCKPSTSSPTALPTTSRTHCDHGSECDRCDHDHEDPSLGVPR